MEIAFEMGKTSATGSFQLLIGIARANMPEMAPKTINGNENNLTPAKVTIT